ncbi:MAG: VOC family protein [Cytophagaceae bacterium]|nr:VOC family protein [Cytophagaceae bacterium]
MLVSVHPKLPMRDKTITLNYYVNQLGFTDIGKQDYPEYLILKKDEIEIHFFLFKELNPKENYGMIYIRVKNIEEVYAGFLSGKVAIHPNGPLETKPWGMKEFSLLDPDNNLLTFGEVLI